MGQGFSHVVEYQLQVLTANSPRAEGLGIADALVLPRPDHGTAGAENIVSISFL